LEIDPDSSPDEDTSTCFGSISCNNYNQCYFDGKRCASKPATPQCKKFAPIPIKRVTASTTHDPIPGFDFGVASLLDDDPKSSWQPKSTHRGGVGASLEFELESPTPVARMRIRNGFQYHDRKFGDLFTGNNRVELLAIWLGSPSALAEWRNEETRTDSSVWHVLALDHTRDRQQALDLPTNLVSVIHIEIAAIAHGTKWNDVAISDIRFERCAN
jgi:hypothetical protein